MTSRQISRCLLAAACAAAICVPLALADERFEYKIEVTGPEDRLDPGVDGRYTAAFHTCQKSTPEDVADATAYLACFKSEFDRQDARLNQTWSATLKRQPVSQHQALLEAQRRWLSDRDPFCRSDAGPLIEGHIYPVWYENCRIEVTIRRAIWLENLH